MDLFANIKFPDEIAKYEFPSLQLPDSALSNVKGLWDDPSKPELLTTGLDKQLVTHFVDMPWDGEDHLNKKTDVHDPSDLNDITPLAIVGQAGAGKTRFLFEQSFKQFGCLFVGTTEYGSNDLITALDRLEPLLRTRPLKAWVYL